MPATRCPNCNLVNFAGAISCKRCHQPFVTQSAPPYAAPMPYATPGDYAPQTDDWHAPQQAPPPHNYYTPPPPASYQQPAAHAWQNPPPQTPRYQAHAYAPPYQAPLSYAPPAAGVWRRHEQIVLLKRAELPDACVKCNTPVTSAAKLKQRFYWHTPALYALAISPLLYAIVAAIISKRATLYVGLCAEHKTARSNAMVFSWLIGLLGFFGMFVCFASELPALGLLCLLMTFVGPLIWILGGQSLKPTEIDDTHIWLKGACPEYLDNLPAWESRHAAPYPPYM